MKLQFYYGITSLLTVVACAKPSSLAPSYQHVECTTQLGQPVFKSDSVLPDLFGDAA